MGNNYTTGTDKFFFYGLILPPDLRLEWLGDTLNVIWNDIYTPDVSLEIWQSVNGGDFVLAATALPGDTQKAFATDVTATIQVKVRVFKDGAYSGFSEPITITELVPEPIDLGGYYVSTIGNDTTGDGSFLNPWATWQKGFTELAAGDTLYIRGGTYTPEATYQDPRYFGVVVDGVAGTALNKITVLNYPGETPVLDCRNIINDARRVGIGLYNCDHWILQGLNVTRVDQHITGDVSIGVLLYGCDNILVDRCNMYNNQGMGLDVSTGSSNILILNCDAYDNCDPYSAYGNADGFGSNANTYGADITFRGCRAWNNSDDGFDYYADNALVTTDGCWSWHNGYREDGATAGGDGSGFKLGSTDAHPAVLLRIMQNNMAFMNRRSGINSNSANCLMNFYNNIIYGNVLHGIWIFVADLAYIFRNNISFGNLSGYNYLSATQLNYVIDHNTYDVEWQPAGLVATIDDFVSVTPEGVDGARQASGALPVIEFLHLKLGSALIGAGLAVVGLVNDCDGVAWGAPPSIGAYEFV